MKLRKARIDDVIFLSECFHMAMLIEKPQQTNIEVFAKEICSRDDTLYSWRNAIIAEYDGKCVGMINAYEGGKYHQMAKITMNLAKKYLNIEFENMDDETSEGEYYLDTLAVLPEYRGKGIGKDLILNSLKEGLRLGLKVTLAVDPSNPRAQKLYKSLGFITVGNLFIFGHDFIKMQYEVMDS